MPTPCLLLTFRCRVSDTLVKTLFSNTLEKYNFFIKFNVLITFLVQPKAVRFMLSSQSVDIEAFIVF